MKKIILGTVLIMSAIIDLSASGVENYKKCSACHGLNAEKQALGKSEVIAAWKADKILEALKGYKSGNRNTKGVGALMKGRVASLSENDMKELAEYISAMKK